MLMKPFIKYIIFSLLFVAVLIGLGAHLIQGTVDLELRKSTYTRTQFDFHIAAPSQAQVADLEAQNAVACVFPYYAYTNAFSRDEGVLLLISDDIQDHSASLLTEGTLIQGTFHPDGAMLDVTAAEALGVTVGASIALRLLGKTYTRVVSAIYLPSTLSIMEKGIVLVAQAGDLAAATTPNAYGGAFVVAKDSSAVTQLLTDYAGEGNVALSYEAYVDLHCGRILPNQTQEAYEASCRERYDAYRTEVLETARKGGGQVVDKQEAYSLLQEKVLTTEQRLTELHLLTVIAAFTMFVLVNSLFVTTNRGNDRIKRDAGMSLQKMLVTSLLPVLASAVAIAAITAAVLGAIASGTYFPNDCTRTLLSLAVIAPVATIPVAIVVCIYVTSLYRNSSAKE